MLLILCLLYVLWWCGILGKNLVLLLSFDCWLYVCLFFVCRVCECEFFVWMFGLVVYGMEEFCFVVLYLDVLNVFMVKFNEVKE